MKGKKFIASEKYFISREDEYLKKLKNRELQITLLRSQLEEFKEVNDGLECKNLQLEKENQRLLEYTHLSKEDIKKACERDKSISAAMDLVERFGSNFPK
jgi:cell shape-determining protein MreC